MSDIFISYSSKDKEKADQLSELLASAGLSVWIDQSALDVATSWSAEIVDAINGCQAFVVLLSPNSIESHNVIKEVSLASEKRKKILPLDLEPVSLPRELEYQLAGIHRTPMTNIDSIIRALSKLGLEATQAPTLKLVKETDSRKSLMILPFEDLSPTGDNGWFADGIVNELISALSNIKSLRVADQQATKDYKRYQGTLPKYAMEMSIRYFIQGDVRKFGDQIKITSRLLDIESGDHLWQDSLKGTMDDIFDIQETVAQKVVDGLKVHLGAGEQEKLTERGTGNVEAYELFLKAGEHYARDTKEGYFLANQLYSEALKLDPDFANAYQAKARVLGSIYRAYNNDPALLDEAMDLVQKALVLKPDLWTIYYSLSFILLLQGKHKEAEQASKDYIQNAPDDIRSHLSLGFFYMETAQDFLAIAPFEEALKRNPENLNALFNLLACCQEAKLTEKQKHWAEIAIPIHKKYLRLFPEDEDKQVHYAVILKWAGRDNESRIAAKGLENLRDGAALYNTACLQCELEDYPSALRTFHKAIDAGFRHIRLIKLFFIAEKEGIGKLKGTPEYEDIRNIVENILAEHEAKKNG